jgi:hypothetical protein
MAALASSSPLWPICLCDRTCSHQPIAKLADFGGQFETILDRETGRGGYARVNRGAHRPRLHFPNGFDLHWPAERAPQLGRDRPDLRARHFLVCLKYLKSGGAWSFLAGIKKSSALMT